MCKKRRSKWRKLVRSILEQSARKLDRKKHHSFAKGGNLESMSFIEANSFVIDRVCHNPTGACYVRSGDTAVECIGKQFASQPYSLEIAIDGEATDKQQRNLFGHSAPKFRRR